MIFVYLNILGGLFNDEDPSRQAFILSINAVNKMRHNSDEFSNVFLVPETMVITKDPFEVSQNGEYTLNFIL